MKKIILASGSPVRKRLLTQIKIPFEVFLTNVFEGDPDGLCPADYVKEVSVKKALCAQNENKSCIIISADTVAVLDGLVLKKPLTKENSVSMLKKLSGKRHSMITGLTILDTDSGKIITEATETFVYMREISDTEIDRYIKTGEPFDKAGAYGIQDLGGIFVEKIEGDFFNIMGLPIERLCVLLSEFGFSVSECW